jgi:hypothetical protein
MIIILYGSTIDDLDGLLLLREGLESPPEADIWTEWE